MIAGMKGQTGSIADYIAALPDGVRESFARVRDAIVAVVPEAEETIKYSMPCWCLRGDYVIYAAAWTHHIGLYPVPLGDAAFEAAVGPYRDKKDTVKLVHRAPVPIELVTLIVTARRSALETGT